MMMMMMMMIYLTVDSLLLGDWTHFTGDGSQPTYGMKRQEWDSSFGGKDGEIMREKYT